MCCVRAEAFDDGSEMYCMRSELFDVKVKELKIW